MNILTETNANIVNKRMGKKNLVTAEKLVQARI